MKVIVLGTGAIGAYYGGHLARAGHAVTCFARGANLAAIKKAEDRDLFKHAMISIGLEVPDSGVARSTEAS